MEFIGIRDELLRLEVRVPIHVLPLGLDLVAFPGPLERARQLDYLRQADLFLALPRADGGLRVLEAMAAGLPVVAVPGPGTKGLLRDGENALCAPEDELAFAERVLAGLEDGELRARLKEGGLAEARTHSLQASARKLVRLFGELGSC